MFRRQELMPYSCGAYTRNAEQKGHQAEPSTLPTYRICNISGENQERKL